VQDINTNLLLTYHIHAPVDEDHIGSLIHCYRKGGKKQCYHIFYDAVRVIGLVCEILISSSYR